MRFQSQRLTHLLLLNFAIFSGCTTSKSTDPETSDELQPPVANSSVDPSNPPVKSSVAWIEDEEDLPFDVKAFLEARQTSAEDERSKLYAEGLSVISSELGGATVAQLNREIGEIGDIDRLLTGEVAVSDVEEVLAKSEFAIQKIDQAQSTAKEQPLSAVFDHELRVDALMPKVQAARQFARLMVIEAYHAVEQNKIDDAIRSVERLLQLSRDLQPRGTDISQLVSIAIDQIAIRIVSQFLLEHPELTPVQCDKLIGTLHEHQEDCLPRYLEALKADYVSAMNSVAAVQNGDLESGLLFGLVSSIKNPPDELNEEAEFAALARLTRIAITEAIIVFPELPDQTETDALLKQLKDESKAAVERGDFDVAIAALLLFPNTRAVRVAELRAIAGLRGTQCLVAIRRYELENNELPTNLEAAITASPFRQTPADPFGDGPLKYVFKDGEPTIYSIGVDGNDDGGKSDSNWGQQPGDILFQMKTTAPK